MVELVLAMSIAAAIAAISITYYGDYQDTGQRAAIKQDLDALRRAVELYETQTRRPYRKNVPPVGPGINFRGKMTDPWSSPYRIDPDKCIIYSFGPNLTDDGGKIDDIKLEYSSLSTSGPSRPPRQLTVQAPGPPVLLSWQPPSGSPKLAGYRVERRLNDTANWEQINVDFVAPDSAPTFVDSSPGGNLVYYRVIAVTDGGSESPPSDQAGWSQSQSSKPQLYVSPRVRTVPQGQTVSFTIRAKSFGSPLKRLRFDNENLDLSGTQVSLTRQLTFDADDDFRVSVIDEEDQRTFVDVSITVDN